MRIIGTHHNRRWMVTDGACCQEKGDVTVTLLAVSHIRRSVLLPTYFGEARALRADGAAELRWKKVSMALP